MNQDLQAVAARLIVGLVGPDLDPAERRWLAHWRPAGVILFARNCRDLPRWRRLLGELQAVLPPGAEICADHEGGPVSFLQAVAGRPPAPLSLGDLDAPDLTRQVHRLTGERLLELGLTRVLAPCCDVLTRLHNPVIGARAFGRDPVTAGRHAAAAMAGLRDAGLAGCAKHWPGHGATLVDTHAGPAGEAASAGAAAPFLAAVQAGADMVMLGHLPAGGGRPPATLDPQAILDLRRRLGAGLALVSDDVTMGALRAPMAARGIDAGDGLQEGLVDPALLPAAWLELVAAAGCDRLLLRGIPWRALPPAGGERGPGLPPLQPPLDLLPHGPASPLYDEVRRLATAAVALRPGPAQLLWFDATRGDRLGEAATLLPQLERLWPQITHLEAAADRLAPASPWSSLLVTSFRPLSIAQVEVLRAVTATEGVALAAGHPSLAGDLRRLLGATWRVDAIYDLAGDDFGALVVGP